MNKIRIYITVLLFCIASSANAKYSYFEKVEIKPELFSSNRFPADLVKDKKGNFENLTDGNNKTVWDSNYNDYPDDDKKFKEDHYIQIELEKPLNKGDKFWYILGRPDSECGIDGYTEDNPKGVPTHFMIYGSNDGNNFEFMHHHDMNAPQAGISFKCNNNPLDIKTDNCKYIRFVCTENKSDYFSPTSKGNGENIHAMRISSFEIFVEHKPQPGYGSFPLAGRNQTGYNGKLPNDFINVEALFDNNYSSYWESYYYNESEQDFAGRDNDSFVISMSPKLSNLFEIKKDESGSNKKIPLTLLLGRGNDELIVDKGYEENEEDKEYALKFLNRKNGFPTRLAMGYWDKHESKWQWVENYDIPSTEPGASTTLTIEVDPAWESLIFWCEENEGNLKKIRMHDNNGLIIEKDENHCMLRLAELQLYADSKIIDLEKDNFDIFYTEREFKDYGWQHTHGIVEDKFGETAANGDYISINNWGRGNWMGNITENEGNWKDGEYQNNTRKKDLADAGISFPDFSYINDFDDIARVEIEGVRQRTYTVVHEVLAIPGERVDLYPFSDIYTAGQYNEQFIRWYDYKTDKSNKNLYFFTDPKAVIKNNECGFFAGSYLMGSSYRGQGAVASVYFPQKDYSDKIEETWIAADLSNTFSDNFIHRMWGARVENGNNLIIEPIIHSRHIFHITSGQDYAENFSGSVEKNRAYVKKNRRYISARAGNYFKIRLEHAMPEEKKEDAVKTKSAIYYKTQDGKYSRVCSYEICAYDINSYIEEDISISNLKAHAISEENGGRPMFKPDNWSDYITVKSDIETTIVNTEHWLKSSQKFYRAISCDADLAKVGTYRVRVYGKDSEGKVITIYGSYDKPLVVAEYDITFLPETLASFVDEEKLNKEEKYETHREDYLERIYGNNGIIVNFDKYNLLRKPGYSEEFINKDIITEEIKDENGNVSNQTKSLAHRVKYPANWDNSNYSFSYNVNDDYNMYRIADHSSGTAFHSAADKISASSNYFDAVDQINQGGVYDRLFYNSKGLEKGMFLYVNAASDPGEMTKIDIPQLCPGSTLYVSAWVNEFSEGNPETANVIFNFYVNISNGNGEKRSVQLHGFSTGYVKVNSTGNLENKKTDNVNGDQGKWMHAYYSFIPDLGIADLKEGETVNSYQLVLENNCISSEGADYAIDDVRVYIARPRVTATQMTPICINESILENHPVDILIETPFDVLMKSIGEVEVSGDSDGENLSLYYTFIDKKNYDAIYDKTKDITKAFTESVLSYRHIHIPDGIDNDTKWGRIIFNTNFDRNPEYNSKNPSSSAMRKNDGERILAFITQPYNKDIAPGKEYYVVLYVSKEDDKDYGNFTDEYMANIFDINGGCAKYDVFRIQGPSIVKVDGIYQADPDNVSCCENQCPVVQLDLFTLDSSSKSLEIVNNDNETTRNAYFDWYLGSYEDFYNEKMPETDTSLWEILIEFRDEYHESSTYDMPITDKYNEDRKNYLKKLCDKSDDSQPKLFLNSSSFIFPSLKLAFGADGKKEESHDYFAVAVPIDISIKETDRVICTEPTEIKMTVKNSSPVLTDGFRNMDYPDFMNDVPLRIGLNQIMKIAGNNDASGFGSSELVIPINRVIPVTKGVDNLNRSNDCFVYLAGTNDPAYRELGELLIGDPEKEASYSLPSTSVSTVYSGNRGDRETEAYGLTNGLKTVGILTSLDASKSTNKFSLAKIRFNDFIFREGYYYRLKFSFEESYQGIDASDLIDAETPCDGETVFTIKVVPEYQMWTGKEGVNWNNDENWRRVESKEILRTYKGEELLQNDNFVTDGANGNKSSYAPLDFTKAVIPACATYPQLASRVHDRDSQTGTGSISVANGKDNNLTVYVWDNTNPCAVSESGMISATESDHTPATDLIQYDMASVEYDNDNNVYCRPWYANACKEIHFNTNAQILNQHFLDYRKAWVDMEMKPGRWYLSSVPLQAVVAGDMYLPSVGTSVPGRQNTELFTNIEFSENLNNRFAPAVYQRGWDKGSAIVYELPADNTGGAPSRNVGIKLDWSHVYNDVQEKYAPGAGFSVKTDVSRLCNFTTDSGIQEYVKFRFPKNDTRFEYYEDGSKIKGIENGNNIARENSGRLFDILPTDGTYSNEVEISNKSMGQYFLAGNPFMAYMDMERFFEENDHLTPKFWIMDDNSQQAAVMTGNGLVSTEPGISVYIPPMQGFFIETKEPADKITLRFTSDMMKVKSNIDEDGNPLKTPLTRSEEKSINNVYEDNIIVISSGESVALINIGEEYSKGYDCNEDVALLDDQSLQQGERIFTISGNIASVINSTDNADGTEIGFTNADDSRTVITFSGIKTEDYMLYDTSTGSLTQLYDGLNYTMKKKSSGKLFLTKSDNINSLDDSSISITTENHSIVSTAPSSCGSLTMNVYDLTGRIVTSALSEEGEIRISLASGIYIISAKGSKSGNKTAKIII